MTEKITHDGVISKMDDKKIYVRIIQRSACSDCHARKNCSISEAREKIIEIPQQGTNFRVGDSVCISGDLSIGRKAVLFAFIIPMVGMLSVLASTWLLFYSELLSGISSLSFLFFYYIVLYVFRARFNRKFEFGLELK